MASSTDVRAARKQERQKIGGERKPFKLLKPHRHRGQDHPEGATVHLWPHQAKRLTRLGKIKA